MLEVVESSSVQVGLAFERNDQDRVNNTLFYAHANKPPRPNDTVCLPSMPGRPLSIQLDYLSPRFPTRFTFVGHSK